MLEFPDWRILKEINIVSKTSYNQEIVIGKILYEREITKDYCLGEDQEENQIIKLLNYPKQELFPVDKLDTIILDSIKELYPNSFVRNSEVAFTSDLEYIKRVQSRSHEKATLEVRPNFSQVDLRSLVGKQLNFFIEDINIYQDFTRESIQGLYFRGRCDYSDYESTFEALRSITFL